jgi:beta-glucosidase
MEMLLDAGVDQFGGEECVEVLLDLVRSGRVSEERVDASARRLLTVKFALGLFDDPYVDEDAAAETVGRADFVAAGRDAQARSVTVLQQTGAVGVPLTATGGRRVYVEGVSPAAAARLGDVVADPATADLAVVRVGAPFDHRDDLFLEEWFHAGSLDFPPGFVARMARLAAVCPVLLDVTVDRPPVLTPLLPHIAVLTVSYGTGDEAFVDALTGVVPAEGRLPFDLPRSMEQVRRHPEDVPGFDDPLFAFGDGLGALS